MKRKIVLAICLVIWSCGMNGLRCELRPNVGTPPTDKNEYSKILFTPGKMVNVDLDMPEDTWKEFLAKASEKTYHECTVTINGEQLTPVAIRTKGASSLDDVKMMKSDRFSFTLNLNKYKKGQKYHGLSKLLLNNNIWDATQMKDAIVYDMCRFIGLPAPLTNYACVKLNGKLFGYYLLVEPIDKNFCQRNWPDEVTNIYKPYHNLAYTGEELSKYKEISSYAKVNGDEASMQRVVAALRSVDEGKDIEKHVDIESVMKYMALQTIVVNFDCMTGHNTQNYYLREAEGRISLIPWDYNLAWGGYPDDEGDWDGDMPFMGGFPNFGQPNFGFPDSQNFESPDSVAPWFQGFGFGLPDNPGVRSKEDVSKIVNFPIDTPFSANLSQRTFFMKLLANKQFKARYYHYLNQLCNKYILGGELLKTFKSINKEIGQVAGTEANAFYTNEQFHKGQQTFRLVLEKRAASVLGQINGKIPATWDGQKEKPQLLINSDDINLQELGGI